VSDRLQIVRRLLDAFYASRWEEVESYFADDAVYVDPLLPEPVRGRAAIRDVMAYCHEWGSYRGEIRTVFGSGDLVAVEQRIRGTVVSPPEGMTADVVGREFDFLEADVFEFDDEDRVVRQSIYADAATLMAQLGQRF
jgi:ketosteroid isomerase-like protein